MCARYSLSVSQDALQGLLQAPLPPDYRPEENIAPQRPILALTAEGRRREVQALLWGLIPAWAKDIDIGKRLINARAETVNEKPAFRGPFRHRRCLIPATAFIEWAAEHEPEAGLFGDDPSQPRKAGKVRKQPYLFRVRDLEAFAFAGIWEEYETPTVGPLRTCAILTTEANDAVRPVHERMPCILDPRDFDAWLDHEALPPKVLPLLAPFPARRMESRRIGDEINRPGYPGPIRLLN